MSKVFNYYARIKRVEESSLVFYINDKEISNDDTPDSLQLEDNCQMVAKTAITLVIKDDNTKEQMQFTVSRCTKMSKVFSNYAERKGVDVSTFDFLVDGECIQETDTPLTLELENEDQIDAVINDIVVEGCGINEINGVYKKSGVCDNVPKYVHQCRYQGKDEEFTLFRRKLMDESR